jgi:hypothetical protein
MARKEGLRPIGDSIKKIIEKIQKERQERQKKGKPIRTQPKLPGLKKGGDVKKPIKVKRIAIGIGKVKDYPGIKKIIEMNKKGKKRFAEGGMIPKTPKQKKFAALAEPRDKITYADKIAGATGKSKKMKQGGMVRGGGAAIKGNNFKGVF